MLNNNLTPLQQAKVNVEAMELKLSGILAHQEEEQNFFDSLPEDCSDELYDLTHTRLIELESLRMDINSKLAALKCEVRVLAKLEK